MNTVSFPGFHITVPVKEIAFRVFGWPIHWYGIIIAVGFLLAVAFCSRKAPEYGIHPDSFMDLLIVAVPVSILGARLYYVIFYLDLYRNADGTLNFLRMIRIWDGGLAIYGGILAAVLTLAVFCRIRRIPFLAFADLGSFGMLIGQIVGRWGNFVNVEAYGTTTSLPWRMGIYEAVQDSYQYKEVHPTFLYESIWNLIGFLLLVFVVSRHRKFDGQIFFSYVTWYGLGRAWIEGLRTDSLLLFGTGLRVSQILALVTFLLAGGILLFRLSRPNDPAQLWVNRLARKKRQIAERTRESEGGDPHDPA